jgi:hypothetical protein
MRRGPWIKSRDADLQDGGDLSCERGAHHRVLALKTTEVAAGPVLILAHFDFAKRERALARMTIVGFTE